MEKDPRSSESSRCSSSDTLTANSEPTTDMESKQTYRKEWRLSSNLILNSLITILTLSIILASLKLHTRLSTPRTLETSTSANMAEEHPCGDNANAARLAGCIFDPLTFAWLPPPCYDFELTTEFLSLQNWTFHRPLPNGSQRQLSLINIMQSSDEKLFISWEYHRQHCAYLWLKMHRAMLARRPIDGVSMLKQITGVCEGVLNSKREKWDKSVAGYITFPSCKMY